MERFVSLKNRHLLMQRLSLILEEPAELEIRTGINGQVSNSGPSILRKVRGTAFRESGRNWYFRRGIRGALCRCLRSEAECRIIPRFH